MNSVLTALEDLSGNDYQNALGSLDIDAPMAISTSTAQGMRSVNGYDYDFAGTSIGFDLESETIKHGIALTLQKGSVTSNNKQGYQEYETVMVNYQNTQFFDDGDALTLSTAIGVTKVDKKRYISIGAIERTAKAD